MFISHIDTMEKKSLEGESLSKVIKQTAVGPEQGWEDYVMRVFTVGPGGHTPKHAHPWPHINYVLEGSGTLFHGGAESQIGTGSIAYVPEGTEHQFRNTGPDNLVFICIVPEEGDK